MNKGLKIGALLSSCIALLLLISACCCRQRCETRCEKTCAKPCKKTCMRSCSTCPNGDEMNGERRTYKDRRHTRRTPMREEMAQDGDMYEDMSDDR